MLTVGSVATGTAASCARVPGRDVRALGPVVQPLASKMGYAVEPQVTKRRGRCTGSRPRTGRQRTKDLHHQSIQRCLALAGDVRFSGIGL